MNTYFINKIWKVKKEVTLCIDYQGNNILVGAMAMKKEKDDDNLVKCIFNNMIFYVPSDVFSMILLRTQRYSTKKYVRYKEGAELYSMSERKFTELANSADAVIHVDKIALVELDKVEKYIRFNNS
ncbi:DUF6462 family protein [Lachnoanaerobaculum orale]|jgi:hypothetical protein|nr:DUF6462 family protein [Lachnoanaerobaculum orale]